MARKAKRPLKKKVSAKKPAKRKVSAKKSAKTKTSTVKAVKRTARAVVKSARQTTTSAKKAGKRIVMRAVEAVAKVAAPLLPASGDDTVKTAKTDAFWQSFCEAKGIEGKNYDVVAFGDSPAMMDELAALVVQGPKRATAGLLRDYQEEPTAVPEIGGYAVVVNGGGDPLCVFQTTDVRIGPLSSVDDSFAWDEGEGDRTREWWLAAHTSFFTRQSEIEEFQMHPDILTVFERFKLVWPEAVADKK